MEGSETERAAKPCVQGTSGGCSVLTIEYDLKEFLICVCVFPCKYVHLVSDACRGQKRVSCPQELESQAVRS